MKRILFLVLVLVLGLILAVPALAQNSDEFDSLFVPEGWTANEVGETLVLTIDGVDSEDLELTIFSAELTGAFLSQLDSVPDDQGALQYLWETAREEGDNDPVEDFSVAYGEGEQLLGVLRGTRLVLLLRVGNELAFAVGEGSGLQILQNLDTMIEIAGSYGDPIQAGQSGPGVNIVPQLGGTSVIPIAPAVVAPVVVTATPAGPSGPCTVSVSTARSAQARVGPGLNRSVAFFLQANRVYNIIGQTPDGNVIWYGLQNPRPDIYNGIWVDGRQVTTSGDCSNLASLAPSPLVPFQPTAAPPTPTNIPPPTSLPGASTLVFFDPVGSTNITAGSCVTLRWTLRSVANAFYQGTSVGGAGSTAIVNERVECPAVTTTYELRVILLSGVPDSRYITITVGPVCTRSITPTSSGTITFVFQVITHNFAINTCGAPMTIRVRMNRTFPFTLNPFFTLRRQDLVVIGSDDNSGGFPNAMLIRVIPAGDTWVTALARGAGTTTGPYQLTAQILP